MNLHNIFLITNKTRAAEKFGKDDSADEFKTLVTDTVDANAPVATANSKCKFNDDGYLVDEQGNMIIGVRSQYGIHFMVIEKSMYEFASLSSYYSTKIPGDKDYSDDSYVGYIVSQSTEDYKTRANDVKSKITSFDPTYDYRLYQWLVSEVGTIEFHENAAGLGDEIASYISALQNNNIFKQEEGLEKVWRTYDELLDVQAANRAYQFKIVNPVTGVEQKNLTRLVSEKVAEDFVKLYNGTGTDTEYKAFAEGGSYYYYA